MTVPMEHVSWADVAVTLVLTVGPWVGIGLLFWLVDRGDREK